MLTVPTGLGTVQLDESSSPGVTMARGLIYAEGFRPQFSGHETFPLRYGWLKKVFDAIESSADEPNNKSVFLAEEAIARFGVGKNMVGSMRYWSLAARVIVDESNGNFKGPFRSTPTAQRLFADDGWDPYLEEPASLWWLHWQFASNPAPTTTIYYVFNHCQLATFYREQLLAELERYCEAKGESPAWFTLKRDVDCFLRTYAARPGELHEDALESLMCELGLVQPIGRRDGFVLVRGRKPTLPAAMFRYALVDFARRRGGARVMSVDTLLHEPGSPGRVFVLDEDAVLEHLAAITADPGGTIRWSETAGLSQVSVHTDPAELNLVSILGAAYAHRRRTRRVAWGGRH